MNFSSCCATAVVRRRHLSVLPPAQHRLRPRPRRYRQPPPAGTRIAPPWPITTRLPSGASDHAGEIVAQRRAAAILQCAGREARARSIVPDVADDQRLAIAGDGAAGQHRLGGAVRAAARCRRNPRETSTVPCRPNDAHGVAGRERERTEQGALVGLRERLPARTAVARAEHRTRLADDQQPPRAAGGDRVVMESRRGCRCASCRGSSCGRRRRCAGSCRRRPPRCRCRHPRTRRPSAAVRTPAGSRGPRLPPSAAGASSSRLRRRCRPSRAARSRRACLEARAVERFLRGDPVALQFASSRRRHGGDDHAVVPTAQPLLRVERTTPP